MCTESDNDDDGEQLESEGTTNDQNKEEDIYDDGEQLEVEEDDEYCKDQEEYAHYPADNNVNNQDEDDIVSVDDPVNDNNDEHYSPATGHRPTNSEAETTRNERASVDRTMEE